MNCASLFIRPELLNYLVVKHFHYVVSENPYLPRGGDFFLRVRSFRVIRVRSVILDHGASKEPMIP